MVEPTKEKQGTKDENLVVKEAKGQIIDFSVHVLGHLLIGNGDIWQRPTS